MKKAATYKYMYYLVIKESDLSQSQVINIHIVVIISYAIPCFILYRVVHLKPHITIQLCWQSRYFITHFIDDKNDVHMLQ